MEKKSWEEQRTKYINIYYKSCKHWKQIPINNGPGKKLWGICNRKL